MRSARRAPNARWATPAEGAPASVFLVGFMGSGKSTVGRHLARTMGLRFIDLDERIEAAAGRSIAGIFDGEGEAAFRRLERRLLAEVALERRVVVAAGGGAMASPENREVMSEAGTVVWLNADFETLARRVAAQPSGQRPLFVDPEEARRLYESRQEDYRQADLRVDVGAEEDAFAVAERVAGLLREGRCAT